MLGVAAVAPLVGVGRGLADRPRRAPAADGERDGDAWCSGLQLAAFGSQCLAYAANDGQKMFAVVAVASPGTCADALPRPGLVATR